MTENKAKTLINQAMIDNIKDEIPRMIEIAKITAKIRRASYLSHLDAGFSESESLELCKVIN